MKLDWGVFQARGRMLTFNNKSFLLTAFVKILNRSVLDQRLFSKSCYTHLQGGVYIINSISKCFVDPFIIF